MKNRIGETNKNNQGDIMTIIAYRGRLDIDVEFSGGNVKKSVSYNNFKNGRVKNPYYPSVYGVGYVGEGKYAVSINQKATKSYIVWSGMLQRCYMPWLNPSHNLPYADCSVCGEWHNFQKFAEWYENNYYYVNGEEMNLDKDILINGNKVYSPVTCVFVPKQINCLIIGSQNNIGELSKGVTKNRGRITAQMRDMDGKRINKRFETEEEAFVAYKDAKEAYIKHMAEKYRDFIPVKVYDALISYRVSA